MEYFGRNPFVMNILQGKLTRKLLNRSGLRAGNRGGTPLAQPGSLRMRRNRPVDLERQRQRCSAVVTRNKRRSAGPYRIEERGNLQPQRLARLDSNLLERQT